MNTCIINNTSKYLSGPTTVRRGGEAAIDTIEMVHIDGTKSDLGVNELEIKCVRDLKEYAGSKLIGKMREQSGATRIQCGGFDQADSTGIQELPRKGSGNTVRVYALSHVRGGMPPKKKSAKKEQVKEENKEEDDKEEGNHDEENDEENDGVVHVEKDKDKEESDEEESGSSEDEEEEEGHLWLTRKKVLKVKKAMQSGMKQIRYEKGGLTGDLEKFEHMKERMEGVLYPVREVFEKRGPWKDCVFIDHLVEERPEGYEEGRMWDAAKDKDHPKHWHAMTYINLSLTFYQYLNRLMSEDDMKRVRMERSQSGKPARFDGFGTLKYIYEYQKNKAQNSAEDYSDQLENLEYNSDTYFEEFKEKFTRYSNKMRVHGQGRNDKDLCRMVLRKLPVELKSVVTLGNALRFAKGEKSKKETQNLGKLFDWIEGVVRAHETLRISKSDNPGYKDKAIANTAQERNNGKGKKGKKQKWNKGKASYSGGKGDKCYNCNKKSEDGHWSRNCKEPCRICKEMRGEVRNNHTSANCRHKEEYARWRKEKYQNKGSTRKGNKTNKRENEKENQALTAKVDANTKQLDRIAKLLAEALAEEKSDWGSESNVAIIMTQANKAIKGTWKKRRALIDSGTNANLEGVPLDHPGKVGGKLTTAANSLQILEGTKKRTLPNVGTEQETKQVRGLTTNLWSVSKLCEDTDTICVLNKKGAYLIKPEKLKKGISQGDLERYRIARQVGGVYETTMDAARTETKRSRFKENLRRRLRAAQLKQQRK